MVMLRTEATGILPKKAKKLLLNGEEQGGSSLSEARPTGSDSRDRWASRRDTLEGSVGLTT
jgi:hypothetical protein